MCAALLCAACSTPPAAAPTGAWQPDAASPGDSAVAQSDGAAGEDGAANDVPNGDLPGSADAAAKSDGAGDSAGSGGDAQNSDAQAGSDGAVADATVGEDAIDWDLLDPPDTGIKPDAAADVAADTAVAPSGLGTIYAHSSSTLYKLEQQTFTLIGNFGFNKNAGSVTDIALDDNGLLFAVTFDNVFQCDKGNAKCTWLASLPQSFNGLTFVPKDTAKPGVPALIGIANSGDWNLIEVAGATAKITKLGAYGGFTSSGDAFSVEGVGTWATVKNGMFGTDKLVQVNPATGAVIKNVGDTGVSDLWGVAWSGGVLYGFASSGSVYALDMQTGKASTVPGMKVPSGVSWWGAGVSTRAGGG